MAAVTLGVQDTYLTLVFAAGQSRRSGSAGNQGGNTAGAVTEFGGSGSAVNGNIAVVDAVGINYGAASGISIFG